MRFARDVAGEKDSVRIIAANSRLYGAGGEPVAVELCATQGLARSLAAVENVPKNGVRRPLPRLVAAALQHIAANAARQTHTPAIGVNHSSVTAGKHQQRHHIGLQIAVLEKRFEG